MGFGLSYGGGGGNFLPVVKYDARAGRMFRVDKGDGGSESIDITKNFKAVIDFENVEVGWIRFGAGAAPDFQLVPIGTQLPAKPSEDHRQGVRLVVRLSKECGGDVREIAGTSAAFLTGMEKLYDEYEAGKKANGGKLPAVVLADTRSVESGSGTKKSTNYTPVFQIVGWVNRPQDLVASPRGSSAPAAAAPAPAQAAPQRTTPPVTGSTKVSAPAAAATAGEDDFG